MSANITESLPLVTLVTVTYNAEKDLHEFLACYNSLVNCRLELVVVDNASSDDTVKVLNEFCSPRSDVKLIKNTSNMGVAFANNQGINYALNKGADWIILINNDVSFGANLAYELTFGHDDLIATPLIPYYHNRKEIWFSSGGFSALRGFTGTHYNKNKDVSIYRPEGIYYSEYAPTCCMAIRSNVFDNVGLMDEDYFVYFDDTDFCWRLLQSGYRIRLLSGSRLYHKVGASTGGSHSPFTVSYTSRNRVVFLRKNKGMKWTILFLPVFISYYTYIYLIKSWSPSLMSIAFKGILSGLMLPLTSES